MTTTKPGSVNQQPLYGCTSCYEAWPAEDLRVYETECWCEECWDEYSPCQPSWNDLESYTSALQAECEKLRKDAERYRWLRDGNGYYPEENYLRGGVELDAAIDAAMQESSHDNQ